MRFVGMLVFVGLCSALVPACQDCGEGPVISCDPAKDADDEQPVCNMDCGLNGGCFGWQLACQSPVIGCGLYACWIPGTPTCIVDQATCAKSCNGSCGNKIPPPNGPCQGPC